VTPVLVLTPTNGSARDAVSRSLTTFFTASVWMFGACCCGEAKDANPMAIRAASTRKRLIAGDVTLRHRSLPNSSWSWECTGARVSDQRLLEAAASDGSALTDRMFWRLNADGSCPKFVSIFRTLVPERLAEHLESMADERVTDRRLQAAVTSQLRIPSLTPSQSAPRTATPDDTSPCEF
jgi:hypothetical protein